jgi:phosphoribosylglycinamide formyltransferase-1
MGNPLKIAVLISGGGTTLKNLIERIENGSLNAEIALVISNNPTAKGLDFSAAANIESQVISHKEFSDRRSFSEAIFERLRAAEVSLVVMGGFLRQLAIPQDFENRIINIHPSLIPSFCGKGNYGSRVHQGVLDYGCKLTGCTVHFVDDDYDHGPIIAQSSVPVEIDDDVSSLAARVFDAECELLPLVINQIAAGKVSVSSRIVSVG